MDKNFVDRFTDYVSSFHGDENVYFAVVSKDFPHTAYLLMDACASIVEKFGLEINVHSKQKFRFNYDNVEFVGVRKKDIHKSLKEFGRKFYGVLCDVDCEEINVNMVDGFEKYKFIDVEV